MLSFLRDLLADAEWGNAVFFHAWGKSPARDHEELCRRVDHIIGVQDGFLSILQDHPSGGPPTASPTSFDDLKEAPKRRMHVWSRLQPGKSQVLCRVWSRFPGFPIRLVSSRLPRRSCRLPCTLNIIAASA